MNLEEIQARLADLLASTTEVLLVYLFGSRVSGPAGPASDVDLAVLLNRRADTPGLRAYLSHNLAAQFPDLALDVVFLNGATIELAFAVISQGVLLYQQDTAQRVEYEARVMGLYGDYLPVLRQQRRGILQGGERAARVQWHREALGRTLGALGEIRAAQGKSQG